MGTKGRHQGRVTSSSQAQELHKLSKTAQHIFLYANVIYFLLQKGMQTGLREEGRKGQPSSMATLCIAGCADAHKRTAVHISV